jgi:peptidyl-prolyl cis-trans isomerase B (cyclophilin B)
MSKSLKPEIARQSNSFSLCNAKSGRKPHSQTEFMNCAATLRFAQNNIMLAIKKTASVMAILLMAITLTTMLAACNSNPQPASNSSADANATSASAQSDSSQDAADLGAAATGSAASSSTSKSGSDSGAATADNVQVQITMEDGGEILLELDATQAPLTVANFVALADQGFYDGLTFHRIIPNFMIQGGDPQGTGAGGSGQTIKGEFAENGVNNSISHLRGTISMARSQQPDSASSQFFITNADSTYLDGKYAAFGHVISGMDVVDKISALPTGANDKPEVPPVIKTIRSL